MAASLLSPAFATETEGSEILARANMPNNLFPQAEVRLVKRDCEMVVQSAILPRFPDKVRHKIVSSEEKNWPGDSDSKAYVAALENAFDAYRREHDMKTTALVIDFVSAPNDTRIDFLFSAAERNKTGITLQPASVWCSLSLSHHYIRKNQEYILIDAFGKRADALIETLKNPAFSDISNGK